RINQELVARASLRRPRRNRNSFPARSYRRSDGFLRRVSTSLLRKCAWPDSKGKDQGQSQPAATGRCPAYFCRVVQECSLVAFLYALRRPPAENFSDYQRRAERREVHYLCQSGDYVRSLRCPHFVN